MQLVMFDLDHTLIRCDSFAGFARELLLRRWWRTAMTIAIGPAIATFWMMRRTRKLAGSTLLWTATVGMSEREFHELMDRHVAERFGGNAALLCARAIEELKKHQDEGARVVIVTGAAAPLAERICRQIGLEKTELVGSSLRRWLGGYIADEHCFGEHKIRMLTSRGFPRPWACVYTDSSSDLPLLEHGTRRFLVNPKPKCRLKVQNALGAEFELIEWN